MDSTALRRTARRIGRGGAAGLAVLLAGMIPWWVVWLIEPRPNRVLLGMAEAAVGLREVTPDLVLAALWLNSALFAADLAAAYLLGYFASGGRVLAGWLWGVAAAAASVTLALAEPIFLLLVPDVPGRLRYWPPEPPVVYLLRDLMLLFHLLAVVALPQAGGVLGALRAGARRRSPRGIAEPNG